MRFLTALLSMGVCFAATAASAQVPAPQQQCLADAPATALPPEFAGWSEHQPLPAGADELAAVRLSVGRAATINLHPTPEVRYAVAPEKPGDDASFGGIVAFDVPRAGTYRIALSAAAWVDVVRDGGTVTSSVHGHGPACSGLRKIVDFPLEQGRYLLQIAGGREPAVTIMLAQSR